MHKLLCSTIHLQVSMDLVEIILSFPARMFSRVKLAKDSVPSTPDLPIQVRRINHKMEITILLLLSKDNSRIKIINSRIQVIDLNLIMFNGINQLMMAVESLW